VKEVPAEVHEGACRRLERHFRLGRSSDLDPSVDKIPTGAGATFAEAPRQLLNECQGVGRKNLVATLIDAANLDVGYKVVHVRRTCSTGAAAIAGADCRLKEGVCGECVQRAKGKGMLLVRL
jgi:hypothetical protein